MPSEENGNSVAKGSAAISSAAPRNLADLLPRINRRRSTQDGMLHSVANRFIEYLGKAAESIPIDTLHQEKEAFIGHLMTGRYKKSSVRSYRQYLRRLLHRATELGWSPPALLVPPEWQEIADALPRSSTRQIVEHAIRNGKSPAVFNEEDLASWRKDRAAAGRSMTYACGECSRFRAAILRSGLSDKVPLIKPRDKRYGIPIGNMHPELGNEIQRILAWKLDEFVIDRPRGARIRPISARRLKDLFGQLTGYVQNVQNADGKAIVGSIAELVTPGNVAGFASWAKNERKVKGQSLVTGLGMIYAALRHNPKYSGIDFSWFERIIAQLPIDSQEEVTERKARKYIPYSLADQIPDLIAAKAKKLKSPSARMMAIYGRNELLMRWIVILPWRQRNLRELRIGGRSPNLFKAMIPQYCTITRPTWITAQEQSAPNGKYWQIRFMPDETKMKHPVQMFLPAELVGPLEHYLAAHRPMLIAGRRDPDTLFANNDGTAFNQTEMTNLVEKLAFEYTGVPVNPHLFRDIVAYEWLDTHPEDYLTLSKVLWHRNINTTLRKYGSRFDESSGVARMDNWRSSRCK